MDDTIVIEEISDLEDDPSEQSFIDNTQFEQKATPSFHLNLDFKLEGHQRAQSFMNSTTTVHSSKNDNPDASFLTKKLDADTSLNNGLDSTIISTSSVFTKKYVTDHFRAQVKELSKSGLEDYHNAHRSEQPQNQAPFVEIMFWAYNNLGY